VPDPSGVGIIAHGRWYELVTPGGIVAGEPGVDRGGVETTRRVNLNSTRRQSRRRTRAELEARVADLEARLARHRDTEHPQPNQPRRSS
jgi:hypothetical protein